MIKKEDVTKIDSKKVTTQVDSLKGALPKQSGKTEGYRTWASGPSVLPSAYSPEQLPKKLSTTIILAVQRPCHGWQWPGSVYLCY